MGGTIVRDIILGSVAATGRSCLQCRRGQPKETRGLWTASAPKFRATYSDATRVAVYCLPNRRQRRARVL